MKESTAVQAGILSDVDALPLGVSDEALIQAVGAAFARSPLFGDDLRDIRLVGFLLDVDSTRFVGSRLESGRVVLVNQAARDRLQRLSRLSQYRISHALARLVEARVLEPQPGEFPELFAFSEVVTRPVGASRHVDWAAVLGILAGHGPALSVLRAVLGLIQVPWEWNPLTYDSLAIHTCYSIGMAQRGMGQLVHYGVLERLSHVGRGHEYRLTPWALGRGPMPVIQEQQAPGLAATEEVRSGVDASASVSRASVISAAGLPISTMAVEIGGLVVRVPIGTEIRMTIGTNGEPSYHVGPELKITRRG